MTTSSEQLRAEFEAWAQNSFELHRHSAGEYSSNFTQTAWAAWQAGRASLLTEVDALRDALWVATEHNALHFGETHNTVIQGRAALQHSYKETSQDREDADRFRWLTEDHADAETRTRCREILDRMVVMSYSAACVAIDHARRVEGDGE